jgi:hypothetical protein
MRRSGHLFICLLGSLTACLALQPLGTFTLGGNTNCGSGFAQGATCRSFTVTCPGVASITGTVGRATPTSPLAGTIILHGGGGGTAPFDQGYANKYFTAGYRVVQIKWASDWEAAGSNQTPNIKNAGCRVATAVQGVYTDIHGGAASNLPICYHGHSGGSGAGGYQLAHYNMGSILDAVMLSAGPVFGRIDQGCKVPNAAAVNVCPLGQFGCSQQPGFSHSPCYGSGTNCGTSSGMGLWTGAACNCLANGNTTPAQEQAWWDMSVVSTGASYSYPLTAVSQWGCDLSASSDNNALPQGQYFAAQMTPAGEPRGFLQALVSGCAGAESVWSGTFQGQSGLVASANWMISHCVLNH